jgi:hypothetical protein
VLTYIFLAPQTFGRIFRLPWSRTRFWPSAGAGFRDAILAGKHSGEER